ncbi:MAG: Phosphate-specific transport system accessory protein PhoU [Rhodospirillaceae bacterium]|nr:MAG: Phosphate-specific transport system accessory protein PhoU [Rhodospirillaceae bacterium]
MSNDHILGTYDEELTNLQILITKMGNECAEMIKQAISCVITNDSKAAKQVVSRDKLINAINAEITVLSQNVIALRSPMANDLRLILTIFQNALNLERTGDLAKNIAKIIVKNDLVIDASARDKLEKLSDAVLQNLTDVITAFNSLDEAKAQTIFDADKLVDDLHDDFSSSLMQRIKNDDAHSETVMHLLFISRHLERIGDHAKNIAEATIYAVSGEINQLDVFDDTQFEALLKS